MDFRTLGRFFALLCLMLPATPAVVHASDERTVPFADGSLNGVDVVFQSHTGLVWAGSDRGLSYVAGDSLHTVFPDVSVNCLYEDGPDCLWVGTDAGVFCSSGMDFVRIDRKYPLREALDADISGIVRDSGGLMWFCTEGEGVFRCNLSSGAITQYFIRGTDNVCRSIGMDSEERIIVGLDLGEYVFNRSTEQFSAAPLGMSGSMDIAPRDTLVDREGGRWIAAGKNGLKYLPPEDEFLQTPAPGVLITEVSSDGVSYPTDGKVVLEWPHREVTVSAYVLSYREPSENSCRAFLKGYDDEASESASGGRFTYGPLRPGKYRFTFSGCDNLGIRSEGEAEIEIVVKPRTAFSPLAFVIYLLLLVAAFFLLRPIIRRIRLPHPETPSQGTPKAHGEGGTKPSQTHPGAVPGGERTETEGGEKPATSAGESRSSGGAVLVAVADRPLADSAVSSVAPGVGKTVSDSYDAAVEQLSRGGVSLVISDSLSLADAASGVPFIYLYHYDGKPQEALPVTVSAAVMLPFSPVLLGSLATFLMEGRSYEGASYDREMYMNMQKVIEANIANTELSVDLLCSKLGISRTGLFSKVKAVSGSTPNAEITAAKMRASARLLGEGRYNVSDVSCMVGFNSPSYFSKCFHKQFGVMPNEWVDSRRKELS